MHTKTKRTKYSNGSKKTQKRNIRQSPKKITYYSDGLEDSIYKELTEDDLIDSDEEANNTRSVDKVDYARSSDKADYIRSSDKINHAKSPDKTNYVKSGNKLDYSRSPDKTDYIKSRNKLDYAKSSDKIDYVKSSNKIDYTRSPNKIDYARSSDKTDYIKSSKKSSYTDSDTFKKDEDLIGPIVPDIRQKTQTKRKKKLKRKEKGRRTKSIFHQIYKSYPINTDEFPIMSKATESQDYSSEENELIDTRNNTWFFPNIISPQIPDTNRKPVLECIHKNLPQLHDSIEVLRTPLNDSIQELSKKALEINPQLNQGFPPDWQKLTGIVPPAVSSDIFPEMKESIIQPEIDTGEKIQLSDEDEIAKLYVKFIDKKQLLDNIENNILSINNSMKDLSEKSDTIENIKKQFDNINNFFREEITIGNIEKLLREMKEIRDKLRDEYKINQIEIDHDITYNPFGKIFKQKSLKDMRNEINSYDPIKKQEEIKLYATEYRKHLEKAKEKIQNPTS